MGFTRSNSDAVSTATAATTKCATFPVGINLQIKQHLRIKAFYGTSDNAVRTQIWIAMCVYALVAILKKQLQIEASMFTILQILSVSVFEKTPLPELVATKPFQIKNREDSNQLLL